MVSVGDEVRICWVCSFLSEFHTARSDSYSASDFMRVSIAMYSNLSELDILSESELCSVNTPLKSDVNGVMAHSRRLTQWVQ